MIQMYLRHISLAIATTLFISGLSAERYPRQTVSDIGAARQWCDTEMLDPIEGIWIYPEDNLKVLIRKKDSTHNNTLQEYSITVIDTPDCRLEPGLEIGTIRQMAEKNCYHMKIFSQHKGGRLTGKIVCSARLDEKSDAIFVTFPKARIRINLFSFIPGFTRLASVSYKSPFENMKEGMIRIYPGYDGNGSSRRRHIYL